MTQAFNTGGGRPTTLLYHHSVINLPRLQDSRSYEDEEIWSRT